MVVFAFKLAKHWPKLVQLDVQTGPARSAQGREWPTAVPPLGAQAGIRRVENTERPAVPTICVWEVIEDTDWLAPVLVLLWLCLIPNRSEFI